MSANVEPSNQQRMQSFEGNGSAIHQNVNDILSHLKTRSLLISLSALNIHLNSSPSGDIVKKVEMGLDENLEVTVEKRLD